MDAVNRLQTLAKSAVGENGFISSMVRKSLEIQQDIPSAFDAYALLSHFLDRLPIKLSTLSESKKPIELAPMIHFDPRNGRVVALVPIGIGELEVISHWCANRVIDWTVTQMSGLLALPFSLEKHAGKEILIPDWCAAFFADRQKSRCIPILILRAVLSKDDVGTDWVDPALEHLRTYSLPIDADAARHAMQCLCLSQIH